MIEFNRNENKLYSEFSPENLAQWFDFKQKKFLHNVDTFYYSVKLQEDLRKDTIDKSVLNMRKFFEWKYACMDIYNSNEYFHLPKSGKHLQLRSVTFSRIYSICLSYPEMFDIFIAPWVPKAGDGSESVTCEIIVQIRSYMLWQMNLLDSFENSFSYVQEILDYFNLHVDFVQENRLDFCWHTNYLQNPEEFFKEDNFYRMRVDRFDNDHRINHKVGSEGHEVDYISCGHRGNPIFLRIYNKTREVVEQGYKPWFIKIWHMYGLISSYDRYVLEKAFLRRSWHYRFFARLEFYSEYGSDDEMVQKCKAILSGKLKIEEDALISLADTLTPKLNIIINIEYQVNRRAFKTFQLIPFDCSEKGYSQRLHLVNKNRKLITDYLTSGVFRLVKYDPNVKKCLRPNCGFWDALRRTKCMDVRKLPGYAKLVRKYNNHLSSELVKSRFLSSAVTYGLYTRGSNDSSPVQDAFEAILCLNDNDIQYARRKKSEKLTRLDPDELSRVYLGSDTHDFGFVDKSTGEVYSYDTLPLGINQDKDVNSDEFSRLPEDFSFDEE